MPLRDPLHEKLYEILVRQNHRALLAYALSLAGDRHLAEDLLQDALVVAFEKIADFDQERDFAAWVRGIVRNRFLQHIGRHRERSAGAIERLAQADELAAEFADLESAAGPGGVFGALRTCLESLGELPRRTVELVYFQGLSVGIAAERTGTNPATAQKRVERARAALYRCIRRLLAEDEEALA